MTTLSEKKGQAFAYFKDARKAEEQNCLEEAIRLVRKATSLRPSVSYYWAMEGQILKNSGKHEEGIVAAEKAIELEPETSQYWTLLGLCKVALGRYEEAASAYKRSIELEEDFGTYTLLAAVECEFDDEQAIIHAERALELNPDWDEAKNILADAKEMKRTGLAPKKSNLEKQGQT